MPMWHRNPVLRLSVVNSAYVHSVDAKDAAEVISNGMELVEPMDGVTPMAAAASALESGVPNSRLVPATIEGERRMMRVVDVPLGDAGVAGYAIDMHELEHAHRRRSDEHTSELQSLIRTTYAVFCLQKNTQ